MAGIVVTSTTTGDGVRRQRRSVAVLVGAVLLVVGGGGWALRTAEQTGDLWVSELTGGQLSHHFEGPRRVLHGEVGAVRYESPDSTGRDAVRELIAGTGRSFRFVGVTEDGATTAEVLLTAEYTVGIVRSGRQTTSVCLAVTVTPRSFWGRGTVTSEQTPCTTSAVSAAPRDADVVPSVPGLDRLRTAVRKPPPPPEPEERPDYPICYSGSDCSEYGG